MNNIRITTSHKLSEQTKQLLEKKLVAKFGSHPFQYKVDESLLVGLLIEFRDEELAFNLSYQMDSLFNKVTL